VHYQGSTGTLTCWAPVGDCPIELGPLAVLPGSHKVRKVLPHHFSLGAGGLIIDLSQETPRHPELDKPWLSTNFEVGDTLFFPALTVHKALPNVTADRMRISLDNRYEAVGSRIAEHMLVPHMTDVSPLSWEEVYAGWKRDDLKYYWTRVEFKKIRRYWGYAQKGFAEALELARQQDKRGIRGAPSSSTIWPDACSTLSQSPTAFTETPTSRATSLLSRSKDGNEPGRFPRE